MASYSRDLVGYAAQPPNPNWPGSARLALQFVLNYEEGAENCVLNGDRASESFLSEMIAAEPREGVRHMSMESLYEYGSRTGVWRLLRLFRNYHIPITIFSVALAAEKNPAPIEVALNDGHEICSHGYRWIDYQYVPLETEALHMHQAIDILQRITGERSKGWYTGRTSPNTRRLLLREGGFLYDADDYSDDLPFWTVVEEKRHLIIPYTLDVNDMRFVTPQGFNCGEQFFTYLRDTFDFLYAEGETTPKMMSVGLHCRITGKPGRAAAIERFIRHVLDHQDVWICRRVDIARHWHTHFSHKSRLHGK